MIHKTTTTMSWRVGGTCGQLCRSSAPETLGTCLWREAIVPGSGGLCRCLSSGNHSGKVWTSDWPVHWPSCWRYDTQSPETAACKVTVNSFVTIYYYLHYVCTCDTRYAVSIVMATLYKTAWLTVYVSWYFLIFLSSWTEMGMLNFL